jgi:hypothetical protein
VTEDHFDALVAFESRASDPMRPFIEALRRCGHELAAAPQPRLDQRTGRWLVRLLVGIVVLGVLIDVAAAAVGLSDAPGLLSLGVIVVVMAAFVALIVGGELPQ